MRDRPYLGAGESPRPYGEIVVERASQDADELVRRRMLRDIEAIENEAAGLTDPLARKLRQCDAEALRSALEERRRS